MINIILMLQFINFKNQFYSIYFTINIILDFYYYIINTFKNAMHKKT